MKYSDFVHHFVINQALYRRSCSARFTTMLIQKYYKLHNTVAIKRIIRRMIAAHVCNASQDARRR
jgi:hypothetical protein